MCGLVSIIDLTYPGLWGTDGEMFARMLLLNSLRGMDSTGVAGIRKDGEADVVKVLGHPFNLFQSKTFPAFKFRITNQYNALLGHGRFATKGKIKVDNAHPFRRGDVTLIHNGTLTNFEKLRNEYKDPSAFEVDSDLCANHIHKDGYETALEKFEGAFAFIWHNTSDHTIRAVRNSERPLYIFERSDILQYFLSSDPAIFEYLKASNNVLKGSWKTIPVGDMLEFNMEKRIMKTIPVKLHTKIYPVYPMNSKYIDSEFDSEYAEIWNHVTEKTTPDKVEKLPEPPKPRKKNDIVTYYKKGRLEFNIGDTVNFQMTEYDEKEDQNTRAQWSIIKGIAFVDMPVEIRARYEEDINILMEASVLSGKILSIHVNDEAAPHICRLYLGDIRVVPTKKSTVIDGEFTEFLPLSDGSNIPKHRFEALIKQPCVCGTKVLVDQSANCLLVKDKLYCPDCTLNGKYPKND